MVLDMAGDEVGVEGFEVEEGGDVRVGGGAVVAFVEVVGEDFPVVVALGDVSLVTDMEKGQSCVPSSSYV